MSIFFTLKRCCRSNRKFFGPNHNWKKCPICKHWYIDEYPKLTLVCKCGKYPIKKCESIEDGELKSE